MVDHYSDEEQVEAIKKWLKTNGPGLIAGIAIGLAVIGGWQLWSRYQTRQAETASQYYDAMMQAVAQDDVPFARGQAVVLMENYSGSTYAALAALMLAKVAARDGDNAQAIDHLQWVLEHVDDSDMADVARLRLARVLLAEERYDEAQEQLGNVESPAFKAEVEELKGDVHLARDEIEQARTAYQAAQAATGPENNPTLQLKLENLPSAQ